MKKESIKSHLAKYSINRKRRTTINHAFASAIAPVDTYDEARLVEALQLLGQDADGQLTCVYCGTPAETWDHLIGLVEKAELRGYGHQLGNLVPCCRACNSKKGAKAWDIHLRAVAPEQSVEAKYSQITCYLSRYAAQVDTKRAEEMLPDCWKRYCEIKQEIFGLMGEADALADQLRSVVVSKQD
ncbi:MAG: HNH endonuclease [Terracidiphilus sp.]|jgi:5-methylcytosine-specific restriction endonuclease McrA